MHRIQAENEIAQYDTELIVQLRKCEDRNQALHSGRKWFLYLTMAVVFFYMESSLAYFLAIAAACGLMALVASIELSSSRRSEVDMRIALYNKQRASLHELITEP